MPEEVFETPQPVQPVEPKSTNWPKIIFAAVLGIGLLAAAAYAGYWYGAQQVQQSEKPTPVVSQPTPKTTPTPEPTPTPSIEDEVGSWKTFQGNKYTVRYPSDWALEGPHTGVSGFPEEIIIFSPDRYTALSITLGQSPYGFAGSVEFKPGNTFTIKVGDVEYEVTESRSRSVNLSDTIFWDLKASKHTALGIGVSGEQEELPFHFVFGNDYPSHARSSDKPDSEKHYSEDLETVFQILSTFKFLD